MESGVRMFRSVFLATATPLRGKLVNFFVSALPLALRAPPGRVQYNIALFANLIATYESAQYVMDKLPRAADLQTQGGLLVFGIDQAKNEGLVLEFGVWKGETLRLIADRASQRAYGFDSFVGVDTPWRFDIHMREYDVGGRPPEDLPSNVEIVPGLFEDTLPTFVAQHDEPIRFLHIDSDIYESAATILAHLGDRLVSGSVIVFDEYFV